MSAFRKSSEVSKLNYKLHNVDHQPESMNLQNTWRRLKVRSSVCSEFHKTQNSFADPTGEGAECFDYSAKDKEAYFIAFQILIHVCCSDSKIQFYQSHLKVLRKKYRKKR
uniref:Uncharacterized protein n=1 Tax=Oryzias latipes TaxID=8090 RepID=A0A3P9IQV9_ORYLA